LNFFRLQFGNANITALDDDCLVVSTSVGEGTSMLSDELIHVQETLPNQPSTPTAQQETKTNIAEFYVGSGELGTTSALDPSPESYGESTEGSASEPLGATSEIPVPKTSSWTSRSAGDAGFLSEFYNNSRLHHLSTMGATFKQYVNELREKSDKAFPGRDELKTWMLKKNSFIIEKNADRDEIDDEIVDDGNSKEDLMEKVP
jgi:hypothetical protein